MRIDVDGVSLEVAVEGRGPAVLLLHGWPDSGDLWRHQVADLTRAGYRTITPDLRGFGRSDRPDGVEAYAMPTLVGDVLGILDHLDVERAHVVGHDWGAALAWVTASLAPTRVDHLVAVSVGHPAAFRTAGIRQQEKSFYMLLFQFEGVAERWLADDDWANLRAWAAHPDPGPTLEALGRPGALTASLNWYRANLPPESLVGPPLELPPIGSPTMGVWGTDDFALTEPSMTGSATHVAGPWRYERVEGAGHWVPLDAPARLSELLLDFLPLPAG